ncbi:type II toxin-antitoxin system RelE/ParE family toxin [Geminocystis sp. CENA526]|uniref:type II toxin-antitoxin system RelE/ParE family toxin n=1 Tax=Geminocystis sp. CENA526 TaxID=1355871 RepID=UPI003D6E88A6
MKYVFHPLALQEYSETVEYYAQQGIKLAQDFINQVENAIFRLSESPYSYAIVDKNIRRCLTRKCPYAILYTIEDNDILILAVMHSHRNPQSWRDRI